MSKFYDNPREDFIFNRDEKEYRHAYAEESLDLSVGTQIKVLREQRGWRQDDLAREAQMQQPTVSRYENVNYSKWSISTLKKLARAFDVSLDVRFRSFGELIESVNEFSRESLEVPKFVDDPFFQKTIARPRSRRVRLHRSPANTPKPMQDTLSYAVPLTPVASGIRQLYLTFEPQPLPMRMGKVIDWPGKSGSVVTIPQQEIPSGGIRVYGT